MELSERIFILDKSKMEETHFFFFLKFSLIIGEINVILSKWLKLKL